MSARYLALTLTFDALFGEPAPEPEPDPAPAQQNQQKRSANNAVVDQRIRQALDNVSQSIGRFKTAHDGLSPTVREIMAGCGFSSTATVLRRMRQLQSEGRITLIGNYRSRAILVPGGRWTYHPQRTTAS